MNALRFTLFLALLYSLSLPVRTNEGNGLDPHGGKSGLAADTGSCIDPWGSPCRGAAIDKGLGIDPNG
jgi:hypothetical protein